MRKNAQLERKGLLSLKIDDDNNPNDCHGNILQDRIIKSLGWFFHLFAPFSIKVHLNL